MSGLYVAAVGPAILFSLVAAASDWRSRRIPNELTIVGLILALVIAMIVNGADGLMSSLAGAGVGFLLMLPGFVLRFTGAGDVKLLTMLGAFSGPALIFSVFVVAAVSAALFVIIRSLARMHTVDPGSHIRRYATTIRTLLSTGQFVYAPPPTGSTLSQRLPMAPFVAFALLATVSYRLAQPWT